MKRLLAILALLIPLASQAQTVPPIIYDIEANWQQMQALPDQDFVQGAGASLRYRLKSSGRWLDLTGLGARWDARSSITSTQALQAVATVVTSTTPHYLAISLDSTQTGDAVTNWVYRLIVTAGGKDYPLGIGDLDIEASAWTGASAILSNVTAAAYTDSAVATHAAISSAHHARYTDAEAIAAAGTNFASVVQGAKADEAYGWGDHGTNDYQTGEQITNAILDLSTAGIVLWGDTNAHPTVAGYATLANSMPATQQTYVFSGVTNGGYVTDQMWLSEDEYAQVAAGIFKFVVNLNWSASSHPLATFRTQPEVYIYEQGGIITNMLAAATYQTWDFDSGIRRREGSLHNASAITSTGGLVRIAVRLKAIVSGGYTVGGTLYLGDGYPCYIEMPSPAGFWATAANLTAHEDETLAEGAHGGEADTLQSVVTRGGNATGLGDLSGTRRRVFGTGLSVANIHVTAYGAQQSGDNTGTQTIGASAYGAQQIGHNSGTQTIGANAHGAQQIGSIAWTATGTNSAVGAVQLLDLTPGQNALTTVGGAGSILLGAGIVSNKNAIVAGDGQVSHGDGSITAGGGFYGDGSNLTGIGGAGGGNLSATNPPTAGQMLYASDATLTNLYFAAAPAGGGTLESYLGTPQNLGVTNAYLWTPTRFACDLAPTAAYTFAINPAYTNFPGAVYHGIILSTNTITLGANMTRLGAAVTPTGTNLFTSRLKNDGTGTNWWFKMAVQ